MNTVSDILIIGGGIIGLSLAIELRLRGASVTILSRDFQQAATHAAAGMLAPQAENLPPGAMLDLCLRSRSLYPHWIAKLEELTGLTTEYWPSGILSPSFSSSQCLMPHSQPSFWLDKESIHQCQTGLGAEVVGGWWFPEDSQINNRALARVLLTAAAQVGVKIQEGVAVEAIQQQQGRVVGVQTKSSLIQAEHYILATGAWANELLPIPIYPKKGQMLSVRVPPATIEPLRRILFGSEIYLVPRRDGRIVIGATSEDVGFTPNNTPVGIQVLLQQAIQLYPALKDFSIEEFWWGFRPSTPDEMPVIGTSACQNLTLATGHYRNGILLAPVTAFLLADQILQQKSDPLLDYFHYSRFYKTSIPSTNSMISQFVSPAINPVSTRDAMNRDVMNPVSTVRDEMNRDAMNRVSTSPNLDSPLIIAGKTFQSRLMTGTGKYRNLAEMVQSIAASACQIVTVAVRRVQTNAPGHEGLAEALDWTQVWMLPNTAGCKTAEEAIRVARLGREMAKLLGQEDNNFVKLEVIPDSKYLLPDPIGTLEAAEKLVKEGFAVLPYINADPMLAKRLEEVGCATVMPLGSPIGSGQGLKTVANLQIIIENASVPVVVDAGIGTPSEAAQAMELGADALLINSAIALAQNPPAMARAMGMATEAGRLAYLAGRIPVKHFASPSSPLTGTIVK